MKRKVFITAVTVLVLGCAHQDPIDHALTMEDRAHSFLYMPIQLPRTATPEQCISALADRGELHVRKILEIRSAHTHVEDFTAVRLDSGAGQKIVLLRPVYNNGWFYQIYDAK